STVGSTCFIKRRASFTFCSLTRKVKDSGKNFQKNGTKSKGIPAMKNIISQPKLGVNHVPHNAAIIPPTAEPLNMVVTSVLFKRLGAYSDVNATKFGNTPP